MQCNLLKWRDNSATPRLLDEVAPKKKHGNLATSESPSVFFSFSEPLVGAGAVERPPPSPPRPIRSLGDHTAVVQKRST